MAKNKDKASSDSENSLFSTGSHSSMGNKYRYMFNRLFRFANSWKKSSTPRGRRIFHRDVEKEEFQYASSHCLSSYYSVFVVRLAIMVMLAILIGLLTILTWHFTKIYTAKSLSSLAYGLRYELLQRPILRMWNILNSTSEITTAQVKLSQYVIRRYSNPASQAEQVELYEAMRAVTWSLFASRKALNSITINYKNGFVQAFHRDLKDNNTFYIYSDLSNYSMVATTSNMVNTLSTHQAWDDKTIHGNFSAIWYREPLDPVTGEKIGKAMKIAPEDLINIAGLSQVPDGVATWHVAVSKFTDSPLLSAALPVWDSSNKSIMAVVGVTTAFYSVGQLMRELVEMHSGHMYLTSQQGYLLATSTSAPLLTNSTKPPPKLKMAVDCEDGIIRLGAEWLQRTYGNHFPNSTHEVHVENAKLGHQEYYIDSFYLNLKRLPLVGVIIIPRKYIMGQVDERAFKTLVILISAALCILVIGCVCILILTNGVSKEMNLRAELISQLEARRKAEASSNYKSQFLANMSHELRTPMAAVIGLLDILISDDCLTNEQYSTVTQIRKCSTALLRLLNNILDLSKVESGKLVLDDAEFDLGRELEGLVDMFSVQCINHNVETVLDLSDDMPKVVRGDSGRVVQVFANLINNSIKFTTSGHVILRGWCEYPNSCDSPTFYLDQKKSRIIQKTKEKPNANHARRISMRDNNNVILWFEVEDTGCGIDPSKWDSVFESFEQADPSTTRLHGGTGLGLCIVRNLVNKMGGEIKVTKKEGQGTLMRLCLLLRAPMDVTEQQCPLNLTDNGLVVLLALQGNMSRLVTSKWLTKKGVCTMEASEWNGLTQVLRELFHARSSIHNNNNFDAHYPINLEGFKSKLLTIKDMRILVQSPPKPPLTLFLFLYTQFFFSKREKSLPLSPLSSMEISSRFHHERENPSPMNSPKSNVSNCMSSSNSNNGIQIQTPPLTPKTIPRSDSNPYPTTFVQADTTTFKQVVQMLTGSSETTTSTTTTTTTTTSTTTRPNQDLPQHPTRNFNIPPIKTAPKKQGFKLYERRNSLKNSVLMLNTLMPNVLPRKQQQQYQQEILSPSLLDFPSLALSPVTPLNDDPFDKSSPSLGNSSSEEDKAIAEKGFYLHPSPITTPRDSEPQLLPLFPLSSPRLSQSSS